MATVRLTCWRDIPVLVTARDDRDEVRLPLDPGFQDLVDRVALQTGASEADAYLAEWREGPEQVCPGPAAAAAATVAAELAAELEAWRERYLGAPRPRRPE